MIAPRQGQVSGRFLGDLSMFWSSRREEAGEKTQAEGVRKERGLTAGNRSAQTSPSSETRISREGVCWTEKEMESPSHESLQRFYLFACLFVSYYVLFVFVLMKVPILDRLRTQKMDGNMAEKSWGREGTELFLLDAYPKLLPERVRLV